MVEDGLDKDQMKFDPKTVVPWFMKQETETAGSLGPDSVIVKPKTPRYKNRLRGTRRQVHEAINHQRRRIKT